MGVIGITNYICLTCGTTEESRNTGLCKNGHDRWYYGWSEYYTPYTHRAKRLAEDNGMTLLELNNKLKNNKDWKGLTKD